MMFVFNTTRRVKIEKRSKALPNYLFFQIYAESVKKKNNNNVVILVKYFICRYFRRKLILFFQINSNAGDIDCLKVCHETSPNHEFTVISTDVYEL